MGWWTRFRSLNLPAKMIGGFFAVFVIFMPLNLIAFRLLLQALVHPAESAVLRVRAIELLVLACLYLVVAGLFVGLALSRSVARPLGALTRLAEDFAKGDLDGHLPNYPWRDEVGRLLVAFSLFTDNLRALLQHLGGISARITTSEEEIAGMVRTVASVADYTAKLGETLEQTSLSKLQELEASQEAIEGLGQAAATIREGAEQQAVSSEHSALLLNEMLQGIHEAAERSQTVTTASSQAADQASRGLESVRRAVDGLHRLQEVIGRSAHELKAFAERSSRIGEIGSTIGELAEQTNLLALNAAIEAARAGEHGLGFAVVADEVRRLAGRSAEATRDIGSLVDEVLAATRETVAAMTAGEGEAEQVAHGAAGAIGQMEAIVSSSRDAAEQLQSLLAVMEELAASSSEIQNAVRETSAIGRDQLVTTQGIADTATEMAALATKLVAAFQGVGSTADDISTTAHLASDTVSELSGSAHSLAEVTGELGDQVARYHWAETTVAESPD